jgi:hypothetical protein
MVQGHGQLTFASLVFAFHFHHSCRPLAAHSSAGLVSVPFSLLRHVATFLDLRRPTKLSASYPLPACNAVVLSLRLGLSALLHCLIPHQSSNTLLLASCVSVSFMIPGFPSLFRLSLCSSLIVNSRHYLSLCLRLRAAPRPASCFSSWLTFLSFVSFKMSMMQPVMIHTRYFYFLSTTPQADFIVLRPRLNFLLSHHYVPRGHRAPQLPK